MRSIAPLLHIGLGGFMIWSGATGRTTLRGTDSHLAMVAIGALVVAYGVYRVLRERRRQEELRRAEAAAAASPEGGAVG